ncbi:MAG: deoxyhypusine synthase [Candidatus Woesearchaeota archaeon]|nr:MAG: deoxyhypusine synthase [Candidatus Woesearchaeota archaeon]
MINKEKTAKKNILRKSEEAKGTVIKGYNFGNGVNYEEIIKSYKSTGFQASNFSKAIDIVNKMIKEKVFIYLGYTSNMVSSGLREVIKYLVKHNKVNLLVTTAGGIEEDIAKCLGDFVLGDFRASGVELRKKGINRIGNIFVPNERYIKFEQFFQPFLEELYQEQLKIGKVISVSELIWKLGEKINNEESIYYWAYKNKIRVFCPAFTDGAMGDNVYFFKFKRPEFKIDIAEDIKELNDSVFEPKKTGLIILGGGVVKHSILNTNMMRNGANYSVYINSYPEFDGSDSGALPEEAVSWGKIGHKAEAVKVFGDATLLFPLLVAETFAKN